MEIIYTIINFLILLILIFVFCRKSLVAMFKERREKINNELDETERIEASELSVPKQTKEIVLAEELAKTRMDEIEKITENRRKEILSDAKRICLSMRHEMLHDIHQETMDHIESGVIAQLTQADYLPRLREMEEQMVDTILSQIQILPGDIAYLHEHDVLYVTLTSAHTLPEVLVERVKAKTESLLATIGGKQSFWVKEDAALIGGLKLRIGDTIYDYTVKEQIYQLRRREHKDTITGEESLEDLVEKIKRDMRKAHESLHVYQQGRVLTVSDGICWMDGLADIMYGEVVEFACGERGMVLDIQKNRIGCVIFGKYHHIESGIPVRRVGRIASVPVGDALLGRVVDSIGHPIDGKGLIRTKERRPIECKSPAILDRKSVCQPMYTGIKAVDALVPIGKGQRELIIGDRQTGKTALAIDAIINQRNTDTVCIYVAIGQKDTTIANIQAKLKMYGAMKNTIIVCAPAAVSASLQYIAPFSATAMGEYFMYNGRDVLIVYDDLSKHAVAYRELSLLLHRPSGREAYPGDIFYLHSRLLERSAKLSEELGGGSMTALPIIETLAGDISSYIPTNVISITDGQIFLDTELFNSGQRPAINVGLSVSRVGGAAQTKLMKQVASSLRMKLAQYRELSNFAQFGTEMDAEFKETLDAGARMMHALRQGRYNPVADWKQALLIYAISAGYSKGYEIEEIEEFEQELYEFFDSKDCNEQIKKELESGKKLNDATRECLNDALDTFARDRDGRTATA